MSVSYQEEHGSPTEEYSLAGYRLVRRLRCAWGDRDALVAQFLNTFVKGTARCTTAVVNPFEAKQLGTGEDAAYEDAMVTFTWETGSGEEGGAEDLISETLEPTVEFVTMPYEKLVWTNNAGDAIDSEDAPGKQIRTMAYTKTRYDVEAIDQRWLTYVGYVNSVRMHPVTEGLEGIWFEAETLLYVGPTLTRTITTTGEGLWTVDKRWIHRPNPDIIDPTIQRGWNWFWNAKYNQPDRIYIKGGAQVEPYPSTDFRQF